MQIFSIHIKLQIRVKFLYVKLQKWLNKPTKTPLKYDLLSVFSSQSIYLCEEQSDWKLRHFSMI